MPSSFPSGDAWSQLHSDVSWPTRAAVAAKTAMPNTNSSAATPRSSVRAAAAAGHEIAAHQWDQTVFPPMFKTRAEERDALARTVEVLGAVSGARPVG